MGFLDGLMGLLSGVGATLGGARTGSHMPTSTGQQSGGQRFTPPPLESWQRSGSPFATPPSGPTTPFSQAITGAGQAGQGFNLNEAPSFIGQGPSAFGGQGTQESAPSWQGFSLSDAVSLLTPNGTHDAISEAIEGEDAEGKPSVPKSAASVKDSQVKAPKWGGVGTGAWTAENIREGTEAGIEGEETDQPADQQTAKEQPSQDQSSAENERKISLNEDDSQKQEVNYGDMSQEDVYTLWAADRAERGLETPWETLGSFQAAGNIPDEWLDWMLFDQDRTGRYTNELKEILGDSYGFDRSNEEAWGGARDKYRSWYDPYVDAHRIGSVGGEGSGAVIAELAGSDPRYWDSFANMLADYGIMFYDPTVGNTMQDVVNYFGIDTNTGVASQNKDQFLSIYDDPDTYHDIVKNIIKGSVLQKGYLDAQNGEGPWIPTTVYDDVMSDFNTGQDNPIQFGLPNGRDTAGNRYAYPQEFTPEVEEFFKTVDWTDPSMWTNANNEMIYDALPAATSFYASKSGPGWGSNVSDLMTGDYVNTSLSATRPYQAYMAAIENAVEEEEAEK